MPDPTIPMLKGMTSEQKMHDFLKKHYFMWWGDPIQSTTYSTPKVDVHKRLCELIDLAVKEILDEKEKFARGESSALESPAYGYKVLQFEREDQWNEPPRPPRTTFEDRLVSDK